MKAFDCYRLLGWTVFAAVLGLASNAAADRANTLRIVTYNIEDDIGAATGVTGLRPGLVTPYNESGSDPSDIYHGGVLDGIGEEALGPGNNVQALDILALQQTRSNSITVDPIVSALNAYYGVTTYASSSVQSSQFGSNTNGNGPSALVYNTSKLQLVDSLGVGTPQGAANGEYRQVMRYEFAPAGATPAAANEFYIYVSNYKSGATGTDLASRNGEAQIIRNDSATLPADAHILYVGTSNNASSTEAAYQTITGAGINQGVDPLNPSGAAGVDFTANSALSSKTHSTQQLHYRDDLQAMTGNVYNFNPSASGLQLIPNTYHALGNDGNLPYLQPIYSSSTALPNLYRNGSLSYFIDRYHLLEDLYSASGHLPVVADYSLGPGTSTWIGRTSTNKWSAPTGEPGSVRVSNWNSQPIDGDNLVFTGTNSTTTITTNDYLTQVGSITFGNLQGGFRLQGNPLTISGGISNISGRTQFIDLNLTLNAPQQFTSNYTTGSPYGIYFNGAIDNGGNLLTLNAALSMALTGSISGSGGLVINQTSQGNGVGFQLSGNNTYSGGTTVNSLSGSFNPALELGSATALGAGPLTLNNADVWLNGNSITLPSLNGVGGFDQGRSSNSTSITLGAGDASGSFAGTMNFSGQLIKIGSGTQILGGHDSASGGTIVNGGTLQLANANTLFSLPGGTTVNANGTLDLHGFSQLVGALNGNGGLVKSDAASPVILSVGYSNFDGGPNPDGAYAGTIADGLGTLAVSKSGTNMQLLSGRNTYTGGTTVSMGTLVAASPTALGAGGLTITSNATTKIAKGVGTMVLPSLNINDGAATPTATLDVGNNSVVIPYSGASPFSTIRTQILYAADGGAWDRPGITDSFADGSTFGLGYAEATDVEGNVSGGSLGVYVNNQGSKQSGASTVIADQAVILKHTYLGDADLNGIVDGFDYNVLLSNFGTSLNAVWAMGDTNYDGAVDAFDYNSFVANFGSVGLSAGAPVPAPVPEPSSIVLAAFGLATIGLRLTQRRLRTSDLYSR